MSPQGKMDLQTNSEYKSIDWEEKCHVNFYLSQLLTGYGCCRAYLYKYGHDVNETCPIYQITSETADHVFLTCPRYEL